MLAGKIWKTSIGLVVVFALLALAANENGDDPTARPGHSTPLAFQGLTRPSRQVEMALRVPGRIVKRPIEVGQKVKAGQLVAELDSDPEQAVVRISQLRAESESEVRAAEVNENRRREELDRQRDLARKEATSKWELRLAELALEFAQAKTETTRLQRRQRIEEWARDVALLARRRLIAPFDGVIWRTPKEVGEAVSADDGEPIAILVCLDPLWVELNLPVQHFGRLETGQEATVKVQDLMRTAHVISVDPMVDSGSATFRVKLELANGDRAFVAGVPASVRFEWSEAPEHLTKTRTNEQTLAGAGH